MLIIKAYVNHRQIDELWIHNLGNLTPANFIADDLCLYQIERPDGYMKPECHIQHRRSDGWEELVRKACGVIKDENTG